MNQLLNRHISVKNCPILLKLGVLHQLLNPMTATWPKIEIFKIQDENRFFGHNSSTDCPILAKFCKKKQNGMSIRAAWQKLQIFKIQDGGRPPFWKWLNRHISVKNRPIFMKLGTVHQQYEYGVREDFLQEVVFGRGCYLRGELCPGGGYLRLPWSFLSRVSLLTSHIDNSKYVRPSVTFRYQMKTAQHTITVFSQYGSQIILLLPASNISTKLRWGHLFAGTLNTGGV